MTQLFTVPAQGTTPRQHYDRSIVDGVSLSIVRSFDDSLAERLVPAAVDDVVRAWGALADGTSESQWLLLTPGDVCLFYTEDRFPVYGRVSEKVRSAPMAEAIWGARPDGRIYELIWFFDRIETLDAARDVVLQEFEYGPRSFQRFLRLKPEKQRALVVRFGGVEGFIGHIRGTADGHVATRTGTGVGTGGTSGWASQQPRRGRRPFNPDRPPQRSSEGSAAGNPEEAQAKREKASVDHHAILADLSRLLIAAGWLDVKRSRTRLISKPVMLTALMSSSKRRPSLARTSSLRPGRPTLSCVSIDTNTAPPQTPSA